MEKEIFFALNNWGEFGQHRYTVTLSAGERLRIPLIVPAGRWWVVFKYRFGDMIADIINFRFDRVRNYFEQNILIGTELLNFIVEPKPYIIVSGVDGVIVVENTSAQDAHFSIVLDFIVIDDEIQGRIRELVLAEREKFRGEVTQLQFKTPI